MTQIYIAGESLAFTEITASSSAQVIPLKQLNGSGGKAKDDEQPLSFIDVARQPIPEREWAVRDRIPAGNVTLFSGEGAAGKSLLLLQQSVAHVLGRDWIGTMPEPGPVIYLSCEDDEDEVCRRLEAIAKNYGASRHDLKQHLHIVSLAGKDATLALSDRAGRIQPTPLFEKLRYDALRIRPKLIGLDTAADVFAGNENDRTQTRRFITLLRSPAIETGAAVVLVSHPSLTGIATGTGLSGNTAWHNSVRARLYLRGFSESDDANDPADSGLRVLEVKKNNYGPISESIVLRWRDGVYVPEPRTGSMEKIATEQKTDALFLNLLKRLKEEGRNVTDKKGTSYAPAIFAAEPEAKTSKTSKEALADAMRRLFSAKRIRVETHGPASHERTKIIEVKP
jgi:RecA-family ATPase